MTWRVMSVDEWTMMLADDMVVMMSPRVNVSRCRFGACKRVEVREEDCRQMERVSLGIECLGGV